MFKNFIIALVILMFCPVVYAHPPSNIDLKYNEAKKTFTLIINHRVSNKSHCIKQIDISLNNEEMESKTFNRQINKKIVRFSFSIPEHKKGDILSVEVTCNRTGPVTKDFTIENDS